MVRPVHAKLSYVHSMFIECDAYRKHLVTATMAMAKPRCTAELHSRRSRKRPIEKIGAEDICTLIFWSVRYILCLVSCSAYVHFLYPPPFWLRGALSRIRFREQTKVSNHGVLIPHWHRSRGTTTIRWRYCSPGPLRIRVRAPVPKSTAQRYSRAVDAYLRTSRPNLSLS